MFEVWRHRGGYSIRLEESPEFETVAAAEEWIRFFLKHEPDFLRSGIETLSVQPVAKPSSPRR